MRKEHLEQVERWANFVKNNPAKWKKIHTQFINAQFEKHKAFIERLLREPDGFEKIVKVYDIKNVKRYRNIMSDTNNQSKH